MGTISDRTAEELFIEFAKTGRQEPFEEIVRRYSPMVFSVCYQVTHNTHDAEDATQAVFLSLAIQGKTGGRIRHIGPWLQRVAQRVSLNLNRGRKRRIAREGAVGQVNGNGSSHGNGNGHARTASDPLEVEELRPLLIQEISQLPLKYRLPLILHYFGGMDRHEIARELKCKVATLTVRIHRGRRLLRSRLVQRGVAVGGGAIFASAVAQAIQWQVSESFVTTTTYAATGLAAGHDVGGIVSMQVLALARAAAGATAMTHGKVALAALLIAATTVTAGAAAVGKLQRGDLRLPAPQDLLPRIDLIDRIAPLVPRVDATPKAGDSSGAQAPVHVATPPMHVRPTPAPAESPAHPPSVATASRGPSQMGGSWPAVPTLPSIAGSAELPPSASRHSAGAGAPRLARADAAVAHVLRRTASATDAFSSMPSLPACHLVDLPEPSRVGEGPQQWISALARGSSAVDTKRISTTVPLVDDPDSTPKLPPPPRPQVNVALAPQRYVPPAVVTGTTGPLVFRQADGQVSTNSGLSAIYTCSVGSSYIVNGGLLAQPLPTVSRGETTLSGWGDAGITGSLDQSGRVIADGYGIDRVLDLSDVRTIHNSIDNPADHGLNGWFARSHGELVLPPIHITGSGSYNWGESPTDPTIDLTNSVRLTLNDVTRGGDLDISLLALDNSQVPTLPGGHHFIGVWSFDPGSVRLDSVDLLLRYDDGLAQSMHLDESILKLWVYDDGRWSRITDSSFGRDTQNHLIWGSARPPEYFAVSAPEPSSVLLFGIGAGALLLRRRRRRFD